MGIKTGAATGTKQPSAHGQPAMTTAELEWIGFAVAVVLLAGWLVRRAVLDAAPKQNGAIDPAQRRRIDLIASYAIAAFIVVAVEIVVVVYAIYPDNFAAADLNPRDIVANYGFVIGIGLLVGATELISRYRDEPFAPLISTPGAFYILINGGASALAYYILLMFAPHMGEPQRVLTAGIAAMTFFRSALFNVRFPGTTADIPVGPNLVLLILLKALDRTYDRSRATPRSALAKKIVGQLSFDQIKNALPALCFDLMQNLSNEETSAITTQVNSLSQSQNMTDQSKSLSLGLALLNLVGEHTLQAAVDALGSSAKGFRKIDDNLNKALALAKPEDVLSTLQDICTALYLSDPGNDPAKALAAIAVQPGISTDSQVVLLAYRLMNHYGYELVFAAARLVRPGSAARS